MDKYILDGYQIKSGTKDIWFNYNESGHSITVYLSHVRLKKNRLDSMIKTISKGEIMHFSFGDGVKTYAVDVVAVSLTTHNHKKASMVLESCSVIEVK